jgi:hypothetical protein
LIVTWRFWGFLRWVLWSGPLVSRSSWSCNNFKVPFCPILVKIPSKPLTLDLM